MSVRFVCIVAYDRNFFFLKAKCVYTYHIFKIHSSVDGHLCCFHTHVVNNASRNMDVSPYLFLKAILIFFLQIYSTLWEKI